MAELLLLTRRVDFFDAHLQGPVDIADLAITRKVTLNRSKIRRGDKMNYRAKLAGTLAPEYLSCLATADVKTRITELVSVIGEADSTLVFKAI